MEENKAKNINLAKDPIPSSALDIQTEQSNQEIDVNQRITIEEQTQSAINQIIHKRQQLSLKDEEEIGSGVRISRFISLALDDISTFFNKALGGKYIAKNDFTFLQKKQILAYLYHQNQIMMQKNDNFDHLLTTNYTQNQEKYQLQKKIVDNYQLERINRIMMMNLIGESQNRIRIAGFLWGGLLSTILIGSIFRKISSVKQIAVALTSLHLGGQWGSFRSFDIAFDMSYPFFKSDVDEFLKSQEYRQIDYNRAGGIQQDEISIFIDSHINERKQAH